MAAAWWWWSLPAWLGSGAAWFVFLNVVVGAIAVLSSRARPPLSPSPRHGGISRRASSAVLQRLRSFYIFSFPSTCFYTAPDTATATFQETEEPGTARKQPSRPSALAPPAAAEPARVAEEEEEDEPEEDPNSMSMEEAYALVLAGRRRPAPTEEEVRRSEVDAKAEEFVRGSKDDLRQQRLNSIFNYTQMLKNRALAAGRRPPVAGPDTRH